MKRITHVDGVEVIEQRPAYGPHPRWPERQVLITGVTHLLMADNTDKFMCDTDGKIKDSVRSVVAHMASHNERGPAFPVETIKHVIRAVKSNLGVKNYCERAAIELNERGVATLNGEPWRAAVISRLYHRYKDVYPVRVPTRRVTASTPPTQRKAPRAVVVAKSATVEKPAMRFDQAGSQDNATILTQRLADLGERLHTLSTEYETLLADIALALNDSVIDPAVLEKAARWDQAQALFGNK